jgi:hypothetical protein
VLSVPLRADDAFVAWKALHGAEFVPGVSNPRRERMPQQMRAIAFSFDTLPF